MSVETPFDTKDFATLTADLLQSLRSGAGGRPPLTDDTEGSVVRTLAEAFARELAVCYQQLRKVYQYGYLDTSENVALDNVVALLGIRRQKAGHIEGSVTFSRSQPAPEDIPVPPGTRVAGREVPVFETTQDAFLPKGQREVTVAVRSLEPGGETVKVGSLCLMPRPIWGVEGIANRVELLPRQREETDAELRERARHALQKANLGTTAAIEQAVRALGIARVIVREDEQRPGVVEVVLGDADISPDLLEQANAAVQEVRPAGVQVKVRATGRVFLQIAAILILGEDFPEERKNAIRKGIIQELQNYVGSLQIGERVRWAKVSAILNSPVEVSELSPLTAEAAILRPFLGRPGELLDASASHLLRNRDIAIGANERAVLNVAALPVLLSLEPPTLDVWVDVSAALPQGHSRPDESSIRNSLQVLLDTIKPKQKGDPEPTLVTYEKLAEVLGQSLKQVNFRIVHSQDNLAVALNQATDSDILRPRERLLVGNIEWVN